MRCGPRRAIAELPHAGVDEIDPTMKNHAGVEDHRAPGPGFDGPSHHPAVLELEAGLPPSDLDGTLHELLVAGPARMGQQRADDVARGFRVGGEPPADQRIAFRTTSPPGYVMRPA